MAPGPLEIRDHALWPFDAGVSLILWRSGPCLRRANDGHERASSCFKSRSKHQHGTKTAPKISPAWTMPSTWGNKGYSALCLGQAVKHVSTPLPGGSAHQEQGWPTKAPGTGHAKQEPRCQCESHSPSAERSCLDRRYTSTIGISHQKGLSNWPLRHGHRQIEQRCSVITYLYGIRERPPARTN